MDLTITEFRPSDNALILAIEGSLNAVTARELRTLIKQHVAEKHIHLILDLAGVASIDSSGLSAIVSGLKTTREQDGSLKLVGLGDKTKRALELTRLAGVVKFYQNEGEALAD